MLEAASRRQWCKTYQNRVGAHTRCPGLRVPVSRSGQPLPVCPASLLRRCRAWTVAQATAPNTGIPVVRGSGSATAPLLRIRPMPEQLQQVLTQAGTRPSAERITMMMMMIRVWSQPGPEPRPAVQCVHTPRDGDCVLCTDHTSEPGQLQAGDHSDNNAGRVATAGRGHRWVTPAPRISPQWKVVFCCLWGP